MEDGRMMEEKREADEEIAAESTGRALRGRTRRESIADEKDRAGARGKNTSDGI